MRTRAITVVAATAAAVVTASGAALAVSTAPARSALPTRVLLPVTQQTVTHQGGTVSLLGTAVNNTSYTLRRVRVRVSLVDLVGHVLNPLLPGEAPQPVGLGAAAPGSVIPFRWQGANVSGAVAAVVRVIGTSPTLATPTATSLRARVTGGRDNASGHGWSAIGVVRNVSARSHGVAVQVAAWNNNGKLVDLSDATIGGDDLVTMAAHSTARFRAAFAVASRQVVRFTVVAAPV